jgi:hypothetical protein
MKDHIIVFDGDVDDGLIDNIPRGLRIAGKNILRLPGAVRPESMVWSYLVNLDADHQIWDKGDVYGITWQQVNDHGPESSDYSQYDSERQRYKEWFKDNRRTFEQLGLIDFWVQDNHDEATVFINQIIDSYNAIAERSFLPAIAIPNAVESSGV